MEFFRKERLESRKEDAQVDQTLRRKLKELDCPICRESIAPEAACLESVRGVSYSTNDMSEVKQRSLVKLEDQMSLYMYNYTLSILPACEHIHVLPGINIRYYRMCIYFAGLNFHEISSNVF